jgi:hypothetical protein
LLISQLRLIGIVAEESGHRMMAVVTNSSKLAYFLRENQAVYDGVVTKITPQEVCLTRNAPDRDGGREVILRLATPPVLTTGPVEGR